MKLTKKTEGEIMQVYDTWLHSYLTGDVKTYDSYLDPAYHFIGSTNNEEFLNRKDTTKFFKATADQLAGKSKIKNSVRTIEYFEGLVFITEVFDAWLLIETKWSYYGRFRFTSVLRKRSDGWRFIYQHFSTPDSKAQDGETIGAEQISKENEELRDAIKRRTIELEHKNRELEIEASLERIRAQAMAMRESADLLDIVVTMRNEFINLGHEAHYFWHMRWLPEIYEKAMTSGDGTRIGMVMNLPRHIHGDIPLLAKWEKGKKATVIYAMNVEAALAYVDKMVTLGDFQQVDPNAPTEDDIRHIGGLTFIMARTTHGEIGYSLPGVVEDVPKEDLELLERFAGAFDLAHKRFEDLKKSEQQAREVQVELALEKVRSRTMGMQKSEELKDVVKEIFDQLAHLSINAEHAGIVVDYEPKKDWHFWVAETQDIPAKITVPYLDLVWDRQFTEAKKKGKDFYTTLMNFEEKNSFYKVLLPHIEGLTKKARDFYFSCPGLAASTVLEKDIGLYIENFSGTPYTSEENDVLKRFAKVFQQSYTRFLDLQKAEAQAREAHIEIALEKVRSRSMAMHKSEELADVIAVVSEQLQQLKIRFDHVSFAINSEAEDYHFWTALYGKPKPYELKVPYLDHPVANRAKEVRAKGLNFYQDTLTPEENREWLEHAFKYNPADYLSAEEKAYVMSRGFSRSFAMMPNIILAVGNYASKPYSVEDNEIIKRFAGVFEQSYTRFLDLKKAEVQAREAQIEAALERVRSRSMAMHSSSELVEASDVMLAELKKLDIHALRIGICTIDKETEAAEIWSRSEINGKVEKTILGVVPKGVHPIFDNMVKAWKEKQASFSSTRTGIEVKKYYEALSPHLSHPLPETYNEHEAISAFFFPEGSLNVVSIEALQNEEEQIMLRFANVFGQIYRRFLDLQKAEAQAREARIEAALERVRSRTMGMQRSEELGDVAAVLFKELNELVDNLWTCGFVLCENDRNEDEWWLSDQNGFIPAFYLPNVGDEAHANIYNAWKNGADYHTEQLEGKPLQKHYEWLMNIPVAKKIFDEMMATGFELPTWQKLHCAFFKTGYLVIITQVPCPEEEIFKRFAQVFDLTYTRFLDLQLKEEQGVKLAEEKLRLEATLSDLRAAQTQLIQSEKMASLGELTAGIAHEIQNPLNFVNNFSEVSKELLEEMMEEMQKGDMEEVKALANDIIQNLDKIHHHGKRADGIVKGMLQHSRTSSGEKEPTDLNMLADEYLRLAYHGLRAKDKSFNATLETDFDKSLRKVNLIAQDIGRVILNLITNAFYVVQKKKQEQPDTYEPTVTVSTRKEGGKVLIAVKDNGNGIPDAIKDKIFQPFFTTKPSGEGTGLGLSMSYDIITKGHGGELKVETEEGVGTQFTIVLPIAETEKS